MIETRNSGLLGKITVLVVICCCSLSAQAKYGGGTGEPNDPYLIYTSEQMNEIGLSVNWDDWDKHFKLMADIDLGQYTGTEFNIIGYFVTWQDNNPFTGVFDGNGHTISNFSYASTGRNGIGLFGYVDDPNAEIKNLGLIDPNIDAGTGQGVGSLVGFLKDGTIVNCYAEGGTASGSFDVGGLVGHNSGGGTISNSYSAASVTGDEYVGGLVGSNGDVVCMWVCEPFGGCWLECWSVPGTILNCYSQGDVSGDYEVGGLVGSNSGTITNCYSVCDVSGEVYVGGLVGRTYYGTITNCYSTGSVAGTTNVGGLVGYNEYGWVIASFWDTQTSGQATSDGGTGKTTAEMQMMSTFTDAGWDFTTPVWTIDEGVDYPRLWWELVPVLHAEPEVTLGTSNTITWEPVVGNVEYYAECAEDTNFTSIIYNSGWITETSCEFTGLQLGKRYWYSVKARNSAGIESQWSNVEFSLQVTLADAVEIELTPESLKNENMKNALLNKIDAALEMIDEGLYEDALNKLEHDILAKMNGCVETGEPDKNDWIITCEEQSEIYPLIIETIENVKGLMNQ